MFVDFLEQTCFIFVSLAISKTFSSDLALAEHDCRRLVPEENTTSVVWAKYSTTLTIDHFGAVAGDRTRVTRVTGGNDMFH